MHLCDKWMLDLKVKRGRITFMSLNMIQKSKINFHPYEAQALIFKMLTHPVRIAILGILRDEEHCVCHMEAHLGLRQAYISQQLSVLREAGLIQDRRDGWNIFYSVVNPEMYGILDAVQKLTGTENPAVRNSEVVCTCPHCSVKTTGE
jgi:DNA-binding transcriptional ArsR family regulator